MSIKRSLENRISDTKSRGTESTSGRSSKNSGSIGGNSGLDLSIPARALIPEEINYMLPVDFGLAAKAEDTGWVNTTEQSWLDQQAKSGGRVASFADEAALRRYINTVASFGARAGQAQILLNSWITKIGGVRKSKGGDYEITGLGADDLVSLAAAAWIQAENVTDRRIKQDLDRILADKTPCRLAGDTSKVQCGVTVIQLNAPPELRFRAVEWYGGAFAGINATYKVSSSWSWQKALEDSTGSSSFTRRTADELEAQGNAFDATMTRKQAVERSKSNKSTFSSGKPDGQ
ncbi:hypothetical protein [Trichlorobacter lovleyi]|uniref:hypothetical protein n=1 Tax=Trichlorobacter lovleyi TaxID=313985 RepID=UPI002480FDFF|nr:hypothetical protein [Trichlorobacter lovleyi]